MPKNVQLPSGEVVEFPDSMNDDAIAGVIKAQQAASFKPMATLNAAPSSENSVTQYLQQVGQDLSQGGTRTGIGRVLGSLQGRGDKGFNGLNAGVSEGVANFMGSPELGIAKALQGAAMTPQHPVAGPVKAISGLLDAATIPSLMVGGPATTAAIEAIPNAARASQSFQDIAKAVGKTEVPLSPSTLDPLQRLAEIRANGGAGKVPEGVMQLLERSQRTFPMTYPEARDFVSNLSELSTTQKMASTAKVAAPLGEMTRGLHGDIATAIGEYGPNYLETIKEYARAQRLNDAVQGAKDFASSKGAKLGYAGATGATLYLLGKKSR